MPLYTGGGGRGERRGRRGKEDEDEDSARWIVLVGAAESKGATGSLFALGGRPIRTVD